MTIKITIMSSDKILDFNNWQNTSYLNQTFDKTNVLTTFLKSLRCRNTGLNHLRFEQQRTKKSTEWPMRLSLTLPPLATCILQSGSSGSSTRLFGRTAQAALHSRYPFPPSARGSPVRPFKSNLCQVKSNRRNLCTANTMFPIRSKQENHSRWYIVIVTI